MPESAAKSPSCLQTLLEKPSAGILLGWEHPVPDVSASSRAVCRAAPKGFTLSVPGPSLLEGGSQSDARKGEGRLFDNCGCDGPCEETLPFAASGSQQEMGV
ncbi:uncharacterized protein FN964_016334 [Alca torda]